MRTRSIDPHAITDVVAIDGPAGAGKSTVARHAAKALDFQFLDTGAMYRAATWRALAQGIDLEDEGALIRSTREMRLELEDGAAGYRVVVDGQDVSGAIRLPEVTRQIYRLDQVAGVRAVLVDLQRVVGASRPTVAEGRDMGTVVFPRAKCKVFLIAALAARAHRRALEMQQKGMAVDVAQVQEEIALRDQLNETRAVAPLRKAADAVEIDTTDLSIAAVVEQVVWLARANL
jgi:cytidylate kinase